MSLQNHEEKINLMVGELRADIPNLLDPQAKAVCETAAEVMAGLSKAMAHCREESEEAFR